MHSSVSQAKKKPLKKVKPEDIGVDLSPRLETVNVVAPPPRKGGAKVGRPFSSGSRKCLSLIVLANQVASVDEIVAKLKDTGVL